MYFSNAPPNEPAPKTIEYDTYVPGLITWLANKLSSGASQLYRTQFGLGVIDWRVICTIASEGSISAARICQIVGLDKAAVSRSFALLEERALLEVHEVAGRTRHARLTQSGWEVHDAILALAMARQERLLKGFSEEERATLVKLLHRLLAQVPYVNAFDPGSKR